MLWKITKDTILYYDGLCLWALYGPVGSPSRCETLIWENPKSK